MLVCSAAFLLLLLSATFMVLIQKNEHMLLFVTVLRAEGSFSEGSEHLCAVAKSSSDI